MIWGYMQGIGGRPPIPIELDIQDYCHALITGASGAGKTFAILYGLGSLLQSNPAIEVYFCDYKNSEDFSFLEGYSYYYAGDSCYEGVEKYYEMFQQSRKKRDNHRSRLLIFDEYPAFLNGLSLIDKREKTKKANEVMSMIAEILMLGRGIKYGVWIVTQRADATLFANGARDNFMVVVGLGRLSKEQKGMIFAGEEIPAKTFKRGEGMILADGHDIKEIKIPKINGIHDWKRHIKMILRENESSENLGQYAP